MTDIAAVLVPLCERPGDSALLLDYDGTLSPIVDEPRAARPLPGTSEVLTRLARRFGTVAVVSARPASFLLDVLGHPSGVEIAGLYGMETVSPGGVVQASRDAGVWRPVVSEVTRIAEEEAPGGAEVESKGLSVSLHWRRHPEIERWARSFADRETARTGLIAQPGKMALELRPPVRADKGRVVRRLAEGCAAVGYVGDDLGDLPAFEELAALASAGVAVARVAVVDAESPPQLAAAADLVVDGPEGVLALLRLLAHGC